MTRFRPARTAYAAPMRSDEAVVLWAARDFRALCGVYASRRDDAELRQWRARVASLRQTFETMWLVPATCCFFHPQNG